VYAIAASSTPFQLIETDGGGNLAIRLQWVWKPTESSRYPVRHRSWWNKRVSVCCVDTSSNGKIIDNLKGFGRKRWWHFPGGTGYSIRMSIFINKIRATLKSNQHTTYNYTSRAYQWRHGDRQEEEDIKSNLNAVSLFNWNGTHAHKFNPQFW
jgi:hypothetical protein